MTSKPRVRFAPSPTGHLHVGSARTALFNWLFARNTGGLFILRIEDTDRDRSSDEMTEAILQGMEWLGLDYDEGPFHQADGYDRHRADVQRLIDAGRAYRCFCTTAELQQRREAAGGAGAYRYDRRCALLSPDEAQLRFAAGEPHTVRFDVPPGEIAWDDVVHGPTRFQNSEIDDFIVLRTDGTPIYNLAVVSDDIHMQVTHVLRGDDHLSNTPKQLLLYRALGAREPVFGHLPMILGPDGKRLSKRHGATSIGEYQANGVLPEALLNFLALLGWSPGDDREIMQQAELIATFSLERINKKSAIFDVEKLMWMNGQHIQLTPAHDLVRRMSAGLIQRGLTTREELEDRADWFAQLVEVLKPRGRTLEALVEQTRPFLASAVDFDPVAVRKQWQDPDAVIPRLARVGAALEALPEWTPEPVESTLRQTAEELGVGFGELVQPLRLALTGSLASPPIDQVLILMEPRLVRQRIEAAHAFLREQATAESKR